MVVIHQQLERAAPEVRQINGALGFHFTGLTVRSPQTGHLEPGAPVDSAKHSGLWQLD
jgi:hypothetical protein